MSMNMRVTAIVGVVFILLATCHSLYCQLTIMQNGNIADLSAVGSNDDATIFLYRICRESLDHKSEYEQIKVAVRGYKIIDLNQDRRMELVLTLNYHSTGDTAPVLVVFADDASSSCQKLPGYTPYGKLDNAITDLDHDGMMEIITADWMIEYKGTRQSVEWPVIYSLQGTTYFAEEGRFIEYYRNLATDMERAIKSYTQENSSMGSDDRDRETLKWLLPMYKALRVTDTNKEAGIDKAIEWAGSSDIDWRKIAVDLLADIGSENALQVLAMMTRDPEYPIRRQTIQKLYKIGGTKFISIYEELLSDPHFDTRTQSYPLRETAKQYLRSFGVNVVGSDGEYRIEK